MQQTVFSRLGLCLVNGLNRLSRSSIVASRSDDPRMGVLFTDEFDECRVVLIGFPYDEGCVRNGGRAGAKLGPVAFRRFAAVLGPAFNPEYDVDLQRVKVFDLGDVGRDDGGDVELEDAHKALEAAVTFCLSCHKIPFVVGGGNDQSAPNGRGALAHLKKKQNSSASQTPTLLGVINIDAHLDVRPKINGKVHSGTPFRELLEHDGGGLCHLVEFACQGQQCSKEHANFVTAHGGELFWLTQLSAPRVDAFAIALDRAMSKSNGSVFVSFDIDAVQGSDCPGVSCPGSVGLSAQDAIDISLASGKHPGVMLMDISELNPAVEDYRSPRLAVMMFYHFLMGVAHRKPDQV